MNDNSNKIFGSYDNVQQLCLCFDQQVELLWQAYKIFLLHKNDYYDVLAPLLYSIKESCDSISFLAKNGKVRDCFVLARTIFETSVNFCFISAGGKDVAERAKRHALQKSFRDLSRELEIGNQKLQIHWQGKVDPCRTSPGR